eukprot:1590307-Amphidinium_carterae.2
MEGFSTASSQLMYPQGRFEPCSGSANEILSLRHSASTTAIACVKSVHAVSAEISPSVWTHRRTFAE